MFAVYLQMFKLKRTFGDHNIYTYDASKYKLVEFFQNLYQTTSLETLYLRSEEFQQEGISDRETTLHKQFYTEIKTNPTFKQIYCQMIKDIYEQFFPDEAYMIYQSFPSVRLQFPKNIAVPAHCDSDDLGRHPLGEKNFLVPITEMVRTKRLFIESSPGKQDFEGIDMEYGDLFYFNGNTCVHYNQTNEEESLRISLDFRVLKVADYLKYIQAGQITNTNPRDPEKVRVPTKMIIGGYYQMTPRNASMEEMMSWHFQRDMLLQSRPNFDEKEAQACYDYMRSGNFVTEFLKTTELEKMICSYTGAKHCVMTTSGHMAIILGLMACGIGPGDSVIVPNYTMIATINSIKFVGAEPILVDVDPITLTLSSKTILEKKQSNTRAVMHVSLNNRHANIHEIVETCKQNNLLLLEDAAQSLGCFVGEKHFGRFGEVGCFSLSTPKIISTGQGGFVITDNDELARKLTMIKNFGRKSGGVDVFEVFGINAKFTDVQAVIGIEQMKKLPQRVKRMREMFDLYYKYLNKYMIQPTSEEWIPWFVDVFVDNRDTLMEFLKYHNIQTRPTYPEINKTPMYLDSVVHPVSHSISERGLFLPSHTLLTDEEVTHICKLILLFHESVNTHT